MILKKLAQQEILVDSFHLNDMITCTLGFHPQTHKLEILRRRNKRHHK